MIDLESSNYDKSNPNWYINYCEEALKLEREGKLVFVSSHKVVRDYLRGIAKNLLLLYMIFL